MKIQEEKKLTEDIILLSFEHGLKSLFQIDGRELLENGKELF